MISYDIVGNVNDKSRGLTARAGILEVREPRVKKTN